jgi:hypothetical protein
MINAHMNYDAHFPPEYEAGHLEDRKFDSVIQSETELSYQEMKPGRPLSPKPSAGLGGTPER